MGVSWETKQKEIYSKDGVTITKMVHSWDPQLPNDPDYRTTLNEYIISAQGRKIYLSCTDIENLAVLFAKESGDDEAEEEELA